jgi:hypothetical protein
MTQRRRDYPRNLRVVPAVVAQAGRFVTAGLSRLNEDNESPAPTSKYQTERRARISAADEAPAITLREAGSRPGDMSWTISTQRERTASALLTAGPQRNEEDNVQTYRYCSSKPSASCLSGSQLQ